MGFTSAHIKLVGSGSVEEPPNLARRTLRSPVTLPGPLHPSRSRLQSPAPGLRWHLGDLPLEDYANGNRQRKMTVSAHEFLRRFLLHTLPRGVTRIRSFGYAFHDSS